MAEDPNAAPTPKPRGRYRLFLDPNSGRNFVPESTRRSKRRRTANEGCPSEPQGSEDSSNIVDEPLPVDVIEEESDLSPPNTENDLDDLNVQDVLTGYGEPIQPDITDQPQALPFEAAEETADAREQRRLFATRHGLDVPLLPDGAGVKTTKLEAYLMILHLIVRHGNTGALTVDLLHFVNALLGTTVLNPSLYVFTKLFSAQIQPSFHFFCPSCNSYIGEKPCFEGEEFSVCPSCGDDCNVSNVNGDNVFISLPLREQIEDLLQRPDITFMKDRPHLQDIHDIMDGELYKSLKVKSGNPNFFTATFNTDGVSTYDSSRGSLWPIWLYLNEVVPEQRLRPENLILGGLWYGKKSPNMCSFFRPFVEEFRSLIDVGVKVNNPEVTEQGGENLSFAVYPLLCSVDSVARAKVQRHKQYNGNFACGYCEHPNFTVVNGVTTRGYHTDVQYPLRTHESLSANMIEAHKLDLEGKLKKNTAPNPLLSTDDSVCGSLGLTPFLAFEECFNVVWGFPVDYMHNACEGIAPMMVGIWSDGKNEKEDFYLSQTKRMEIDKVIVALTPIVNLRRTRPLAEKANWKAREWLAFILYYSLPCLKDFLPQKYYEHFAKFVKATYLLLKEIVSVEDLQTADEFLQQFVNDFSNLYPNERLTYNLHVLTHLAKVVYYCGPLWAFSNFVFESGNGQLLKYLKGTKGVIHEICKKYLVMQTASESFQLWKIQDHVIDFCVKVLTYSRTKHGVKCSDGIVLPGYPTVKEISAEDAECLRGYNTDFPDGKIIFYGRAIKAGVLFYSRAYSKPTVHDDSCVQMCDESYVVIDKILKLSDVTNAIAKPLRLSERVADYLAPHIKTCAFDCFGRSRVVPLTDVARKCIFLSVGSRNYVCDLPNLYERD